MKVLAMEDKNIKKEFATILAFDVRVSPEAQKFADEEGIKIFTAEIIYHLFDSFTEYVKTCKEERMNKGNKDAIYPCVLEVMKDAIFNRKDPIIIGVNVLKGQLRVGTPICVPERENLRIGVVEAIERNKNKVSKAEPKDGSVSVRISG
jgi:translation initiation factor 5B